MNVSELIRCSAVAAVLSIMVSACGADDPIAVTIPDQTQGTSILASETTLAAATTTPTVSQANAHDVPQITGAAPATAADGNLGSGCGGVETGSLPDGLWAVALTAKGQTIDVDLGCLSPDLSFGNSNATSRLNALSAGVRVFVLAAGGATTEVPVTEWLAQPVESGAFWVAVNGGLVTSIQQLDAG